MGPRTIGSSIIVRCGRSLTLLSRQTTKRVYSVLAGNYVR